MTPCTQAIRQAGGALKEASVCENLGVISCWSTPVGMEMPGKFPLHGV